MKAAFAFVALSALLLMSGCQTPHEQTNLSKLLIATEGAYPPFNFVANDGSLQGFDVDIAKALCVKMKADCTIVKQDWDGMISGLRARKFDIIVASMSITEERKQVIDFSDTYYNTPAVIVAPKGARIALADDGNPTSGSFNALRIGVQAATIHELYAHSHFPGAEIVTYQTADAANLALSNGSIDARFDDILTLDEGVLKATGGDRFVVFGKGYVGGELGVGAGIAVRQEDRALRDNINAALKAIRTEGTYKQINAKYFDFELLGAPAS